MLVRLPHGMCVNPEIVKLIHVRSDRQQSGGKTRMIFTVAMKTDDDGFLVLASYAERPLAEELATECARRINKGLGEEDPNDSGAGGDDDSDDDDDDDDGDDAPSVDLLGDDDW